MIRDINQEKQSSDVVFHKKFSLPPPLHFAAGMDADKGEMRTYMHIYVRACKFPWDKNRFFLMPSLVNLFEVFLLALRNHRATEKSWDDAYDDKYIVPLP